MKKVETITHCTEFELIPEDDLPNLCLSSVSIFDVDEVSCSIERTSSGVEVTGILFCFFPIII